MQRKKSGLSLERHKEIGRLLKDMNRQLVSLSVEVGNAYPTTGEKAKPYKHISQAINALSKARSCAEENCAQEHPDWDTSIYYGGKD